MSAHDDDRFCDRCQVVLDLHPDPDNESDPGCEAAERRADLLERFWTIGARA